jgi:phenylacetate-coenzyme A ligase PaaK-like adenylate-forming protein
MPMIRYRIDDRIRVARPAGRRYPAFTRIAEIDGRADDLFRYGDATVHPHSFRSVLIRHASVDDYQIRQKPHGAEVLIQVRGTCDVATLTAQLTAALVAAGVPGATAQVTVVDEIPRTPLGKRLRFMPARPGG